MVSLLLSMELFSLLILEHKFQVLIPLYWLCFFRHENAWSDILHLFFLSGLYVTPGGAYCLSCLHRDWPVLVILHNAISMQSSTFHVNIHSHATLSATSTLLSYWLLSPLKCPQIYERSLIRCSKENSLGWIYIYIVFASHNMYY